MIPQPLCALVHLILLILQNNPSKGQLSWRIIMTINLFFKRCCLTVKKAVTFNLLFLLIIKSPFSLKYIVNR